MILNMSKRKISVRKHWRRTKRGLVPVRRHKRNIKVPPAWTDVKYPKNKSYVAKGKDSKGRWQYIYPKKYKEKRDEKKFKRVKKLKKEVPTLLNKINKDLKEDNTEAQVIYTMYKTGLRPGTEKDTKAEKEAKGIMTLEKKDAKVKPGNKVEFKFTGKKGIKVEKEIKDKKLTDIVKQRKKDKRLFQTSESEVRDYFDDLSKGKFQLKDFRTLKANQIAKKAIKKTDTKKELGEAVAKELGNTPRVALNSYVSPEIIKKVKSK